MSVKKLELREMVFSLHGSLHQRICSPHQHCKQHWASMQCFALI